MKKTYNIIFCLIIIAIVATGAYWRINKLDAWGMWVDEFITETRAHFTFQEVTEHYVTKKSQIFHFINSLNGSLVTENPQDRISGEDLRLPFAILGTFSILAIFLAGKKMFNKWAGLLCAFITMTSYYHIYYSREARYYAVFFLASVWAIHATWNCIKSKTAKLSIKEYAWYALAATFGMGIHQGFYLAFAILNLYLMFLEFIKTGSYFFHDKCFKSFKHIFARLSIVGLALVTPALVWINVVLAAGKDTQQAVEAGSNSTLLAFSWELIDSVQKNFWDASLLQAHIWIIIAICGLALICSKRFHIFLLWLALTLGPLLYFDRAHYDHFFMPKYIIFCFAASVILIGCGSAQLVIHLRNLLGFLGKKIFPKIPNLTNMLTFKFIGLLIVVGLMIGFSIQQFNSSPKYAKFFKPKKAYDKTIVNYVADNYSTGDFVIVYEEPWRSHLIPGWVRYYFALSPISPNTTRASKLQENIPCLTDKPFYLWWIFGENPPRINTPKFREYFEFIPFQKRLLVRSKNKVTTSYEAAQLTKTLYSHYATSMPHSTRTPVHWVIVGELDRWLRSKNNSNYLDILSSAKIDLPKDKTVKKYITDLPNISNSNNLIVCKTCAKNGKKYKKSILTSPSTNTNKIIVLKNRSYSRLVSTLFLDSSHTNDSAVFIVKGDGKEIFKSKPISNNSKNIKLDLNIDKFQEIELISQTQSKSSNLRAVWASPNFSKISKAIYISDIEDLTITNQNDFPDTRKPVPIPIIVDDKMYLNSFPIHPPEKDGCTISFDNNKKYSRFISHMATTTPHKYCSVVFKVLGDGKVLYSSGMMNGLESKPKKVNVSIAKYDKIDLVILAGQNNFYDRAAWASPYVEE